MATESLPWLSMVLCFEAAFKQKTKSITIVTRSMLTWCYQLKMYRSPKYWKEMARLRKEHEAKLKREAEREAHIDSLYAIEDRLMGYK